MCSMPSADESWQDSARELMEEWNLTSDEESSPPSSHPPAALPPEPHLENAPANRGAEDSFPTGATMLYQAFAPRSPRPAGSGSSPRTEGHESVEAEEELADFSRAGGEGRSGKSRAEPRQTFPRRRRAGRLQAGGRAWPGGVCASLSGRGDEPGASPGGLESLPYRGRRTPAPRTAPARPHRSRPFGP